MHRHFTATTYILDQHKVLLIFHRKLQKWHPPGGHVEPNETPSDAAIREAYEETGLRIGLLKQENIWIDSQDITSMVRPYLCLLENMPEYKDEPAHQHMDMIYVARPIGGHLQQNDSETEGLKWFTMDDIRALGTDELFDSTRQILDVLLN